VRRLLFVTCALLATPVVGSAQAVPAPYRNAALPVEQRVADLLSRMNPTEKFWQLFMIPGDRDNAAHDWRAGVFGLQVSAVDSSTRSAMAHAARVNDIQRYFVEETRLGIPMLPFDEALHGLMRPGATAFPQAIALAATWDTALMTRVATAIAHETGSRGIRHILSPVVNITRDARWGRTEETYGEDPRLAAAMGVAYIGALERAGIVATPKHFVANVGDGGRDSWPIEVSERQLEEVWFPPFKQAIQQAGARSVMSAYNSVDGLPASQNGWLLTEVLRHRWGFDGFVISDAAATAGATVLHMTEASIATSARRALAAGLDVVFQSGWEQHRPWLRAFTDGSVPDSLIDRAVSRVLRAKFQLGLFEHPYANVDSAAYWNGRVEHRALARTAAADAMVLLTNRGILPLADPGASLALIGIDADSARLGGYSGPGNNVRSIRAALTERLGAARVRYLPGPGRTLQEWEVVPSAALTTTDSGRPVSGLRGEYFRGVTHAGTAAASRLDPQVDFHWTFNRPAPGIDPDWYSVRWTGAIRIPSGSTRQLAVEGDDGYRLWLDGQLVLDRWEKVGAGRQVADVALQPGSQHAIRLEFHEGVGNGRIRLVWQGGARARQDQAMTDAVAAAQRADVAIVVAGVEEGEFRDRSSLALPGRQEELIRAVASTGTATVVVIVGGAPVTMSRWIDSVDAVLMAWYPGEAGGEALADVLTGVRDPGGRLPITFPAHEGQLPLYYNHKPTGRGNDYLDLPGRAAFPFGHGGSYTTFTYDGLTLSADTIAASGALVVRFTVRNTGTRAGVEVAQLYVRDQLASVAQPVQSLMRWEKLALAPGESREVRFVLQATDLTLLDAAMRPRVEPGTFSLMVGSSSRHARLRGLFEIR
jgi:beta-glucosidase